MVLAKSFAINNHDRNKRGPMYKGIYSFVKLAG